MKIENLAQLESEGTKQKYSLKRGPSQNSFKSKRNVLSTLKDPKFPEIQQLCRGKDTYSCQNHAPKKFFQIKKQERGQNKQSYDGKKENKKQKGKKWIYATRLVTNYFFFFYPFFSALVSTNW